MKVYVKGSNSKTKNHDDYVVINNDIITWYYPDLEPSIGSVSGQGDTVVKWERARAWKRVELPEHIKVAMRLCGPMQMFSLKMAARIDPRLFRAEWPSQYCSAFIKRAKTQIGQICTRERNHSGPHVTIDQDHVDGTFRLWDKPWFTTTKRSKSKRVK